MNDEMRRTLAKTVLLMAENVRDAANRVLASDSREAMQRLDAAVAVSLRTQKVLRDALNESAVLHLK